MRRVLVNLLLAGLALNAACQRRKGLAPADASGVAGTGLASDGGAAGAGGGAAGTAGAAALGWGGVRRLTDAEYDNTLRDLLGVAAGARQASVQGALPADLSVDGFDNAAAGQNILPARFQWYFASAVVLTDGVWADPTRRARIVTCAPAAAGDETCARAIVSAFGRRAWRRPLSPAEMDGLVGLVRDAMTTGADFPTAIKQIVVALLVSEAFLYRVELDPDPNAAVAHPLAGHELATRLSYLIWTSTPDDALLDAAEAGQLDTQDGLRAQVQRLLADPRADGFVRDFAGQWLGFRALEEPSRAPWPPGAQRAAAEEARRFVEMIVQEDRPLSELLTADVNFVDDALAPLYGFPAPGPTTRVSVTTDARRGYLGLVAPLAQTSFETDTSPERRGTWVMGRLLCKSLPAHPNTLPPTGTGRARAEMTAASVACAACHKIVDPIGLGLERFDQLGLYREVYPTGEAADDLGALPDGTSFRGPGALGDLIAGDPEYRRCVARKVVTYALGRGLVQEDEAAVDRVAGAFEAGGLTVRALLTSLVVDDAIRFRRGEGTL